MLTLQRFEKAADFYARTASFLTAREAEHNLMLGLCHALIHRPGIYTEPPYLASIEGGGEIVAAALRTPPYNIILSNTTRPEVVTMIADDLIALYGLLPGAFGPKEVVQAFVQEWSRRSGQRSELEVAERVYQLEKVNPIRRVPGQMRRATRSDRELLVRWSREFTLEAFGPDADTSRIETMVDNNLANPDETAGYYLWEDGKVVSLTRCGSPTPNGMRIGPVYTPVEFRGRGYASACVAGVSRRILDSGRKFVFLFTDLSNPTSNHIYQVIGYQPVCDFDQYRFAPIT